MKLRQQLNGRLHEDLRKTLNDVLRMRREFNPGKVLAAKLQLLREYFTKHGLSGAVVGVSGGIDSAVVSAMLFRLMREKDSPLKQIVPLFLPAFSSEGATGQREALKRVNALGEYLDTTIGVAHVTPELQLELSDAIGLEFQPWAAGQSIAYSRTSYFYSMTSLLAQEGHPAIVVGTTNRDEGAWLGYVGKAADGMVDIQPIADLHKSEVYQLAELLHIPHSIIDVEPTGDMYDGAPDVEVFGAPYDFVELALLWRTILDQDERKIIARWHWCSEARKQFLQMMANLRRLHKYNAHKYLVGSPSVFLDVMDRFVPGGWEETKVVRRTTIVPETASPYIMPGGDRRKEVIDSEKWEVKYGGGWDDQIHHFEKCLSTWTGRLLSYAGSAGWHHAGEDGRWKKFAGPAESLRCTLHDEALAEAIWQQLKKKLPPFRHWTKGHAINTDIDGTRVWRPVGISSVFRVIKYPANGKLIPHYDAPFIESKRRRTLMSVVIPLEGTGKLAFCQDPQWSEPFEKRNFSDEHAKLVAPTSTGLMVLDNRPGDIIVFDHRLLHAPIPSDPRTIMRTDVIFERV